MNILVTNDDGIMAPGIYILKKHLEKKHNVYVVAPDVERSATGHAITIRNPLWAKKIYSNDEFLGYAVNGTPADCVKLGLDAIFKDVKIDMVISGINKGPNLGTDLLYSGTVSGALEGAMNEIPSIAISTSDYQNPNYETAAKFILDFLDKCSLDIPEFTALNINVPSVEYSELKGFKITRQSRRRYKDYFEARKDPFGNTYYWMLGEIIEDDNEPDSDYYVLKENYVSITPIKSFLTDFEFLNSLKEKFEGGE
ncbi:stationary phase survival protein SurE [Marinitoga sp. 1135]|uniref:5'-nucleotidase SurE n=1 Tax=Marinitoga piezophila (strain DSM 14283 / JCM 11233 / KA3) TaxID=443254 RepID=H2J6F3_MARPK|nr:MULTISPECIES: 5'/3'-nucleotidase SurE [Marinitoga]AEX85138.1 5'/3'-nucleotidase SurE [Marinitoga piezophila KA3]APT75638.1 stationary phase survival protein SurE [Marinitoga sp. 1137]NUU95346.1 stationary phase survival protein SurE [Marinitoga sp. 1135]NUU97280.1 stationary phase survival protein SurE [Marinitoga sp. 1138]